MKSLKIDGKTFSPRRLAIALIDNEHWDADFEKVFSAKGFLKEMEKHVNDHLEEIESAEYKDSQL